MFLFEFPDSCTVSFCANCKSSGTELQRKRQEKTIDSEGTRRNDRNIKIWRENERASKRKRVNALIRVNYTTLLWSVTTARTQCSQR